MKLLSHVNQVTALDVQGNVPQLLNSEERVLPPRWRKAYELKELGKYKLARRALYQEWPRGSARPHTDGLDPLDTAELLLLAGIIAGCHGSAKQSHGRPTDAEELIAESIRLFEQAGRMTKAAEARSEMAWRLWNEGDFEVARELLGRALKEMGDGTGGPTAKALALQRAAIFADHAGRLAEADELLRECEPLLKSCDSPALLGRFHINRATILSKLGEESDCEDFLDRALIEYEAASVCYEEAGATRFRAYTENNLGLTLISLRKFNESNRHLDKAQALYRLLDEADCAAEVTETRARLRLAEERYKEAVCLAEEAARDLEAAGRHTAMAEALTTAGVALARTGRFTEARKTLARALKVAVEVGAREKAGLAALATLEELGERLDFGKARELFEHAYTYLEEARPARTQWRLTNAALKVFKATHAWDSLAGEVASSAPMGNASEMTSLRVAALRLIGNRPSSLIKGGSAKARRLVASYAHELSGRPGRFVALDCSKFEGESYAPERFGQAALAAAGGTLFLDYVEELSSDNRERVLLLIRDGFVEHAGVELVRVRVDTRVIAGTSCDLSDAAADSLFSAELFERLCGPSVQDAPPGGALREARVLAGLCVKEAVEFCYAKSRELPPEAERVLNTPAAEAADALARQLACALAAVTPQSGRTAVWSVAKAATSAYLAASDDDDEKGQDTFYELVERFEVELIIGALRAVGGSVTKAAPVLGLSRQTLATMIETKKKKHPQLEGERTPVIKRGRRSPRAQPYQESARRGEVNTRRADRRS